jgi:hypothetical protein
LSAEGAVQNPTSAKWDFPGLIFEHEEQGPVSNIPNFGIGV